MPKTSSREMAKSGMPSVPADTIKDDDVLFGRGGATNKHPGNLRYRAMIDQNRADYAHATERSEKLQIAGKIVRSVRNGKVKGRFLRKEANGQWYEVSNDEAMRKSQAALREKTKWASMKQDTPVVQAQTNVDWTAKKVPDKKPKPVKKPKKPKSATKSGGVVPRDEDVLFGRGGGTNKHPGNLLYRDMITLHRNDYTNAQWNEKLEIAGRIVEDIHTGDIPGRFLRLGDDGYYEVSNDEAMRKVLSALREKTKWKSMTPEKGRAADSDEEPEMGPAEEAAVDSLAKMVQAVKPKAAKPKVTKPANHQLLAKKPPAKPAVSAAVAMAANAAKRKAAEAPASPAQKRVKSEMGPELDAAGLKTSDVVVFPIVSKAEGSKMPANFDTITSGIIPTEADVLLGRGGGTNHHPGNRRMRETVANYRDIYTQAKRDDKFKLSEVVVSALQRATPPSRFLSINAESGCWEVADHKRAAQKISQLMREKL